MSMPNSAERDDLERMWSENPEVIKQFLERRDSFARLCSEVEYILRKSLIEAKIEVSAVTSRPKSLSSFAEKVNRKSYRHPMTDVTDLAGVRVVFLYRDDRPKIEKIIENEFDIVERVDTIEARAATEFGYGALHYLVRLGRHSSGARYDDLRKLTCEVQVRTVLQDAWAIIDHHLSYKQEADVPTELRRKLNALSGLFSTADDQFQAIRHERAEYIAQIRKLTRAQFLEQELNLDTLKEYLRWKFPRLRMDADEGFVRRVLRGAQAQRIESLSKLDAVLEKTKRARAAVAKEHKFLFAVSHVNRALALAFPAYLQKMPFSAKLRASLLRHRSLVK